MDQFANIKLYQKSLFSDHYSPKNDNRIIVFIDKCEEGSCIGNEDYAYYTSEIEKNVLVSTKDLSFLFTPVIGVVAMIEHGKP